MVVTNVLGVAFAATLLAASDAGVTFVFPEDGATNLLAWTQLSPASRDAVCEAADFAPMPPEMAATFRMAMRELRKIDAFEDDKRMEPAEAFRRRAALRTAFAKRCARNGISVRRTELLLKRLSDSR